MKIVKFYGMRHGQKNGDALTDLGFRQVQAAAQEHLMGLDFAAAYSSGMNRANQTARTALEAVGQELGVTVEEGFSFGWFYNDKQMPTQPTQPPEFATIGEYFQNGYLLAVATRGRVWQTLLERAKDVAHSWMEGTTTNVLVASHSPTIETAVPEPNSFPRLNEADICVYTVEVEGDNAKIVSAKYLAAPKVEVASAT